MRPLPWQREVLEDCTSPILAVPAGIGAGKTRVLVDKSIHVGWVNSPVPSMLVEPTYGMVTDNLLPIFEEVLSVRRIRYRWVGPQGGGRKSSTITIFPGQGVPPYDILLRSADDPKKLDGKNVGFAGVDEAGQCKPGTIDRVRRRARHPAAKVRQLMITGTPENLGEYYEWCEAKPQPGTRLIRADTTQNTYLPDDYVSTTLSHLDEQDREQYMRGRFITRGSRAFRAFDQIRHHARISVGRGERFEVGADFNVGKMSWVESVRRGDMCHVFGELVRYDTTTWDQGEALARHLQQRILRDSGEVVSPDEVKRRTRIYADPSSKSRHTGASESDVMQLRRMGYEVHVEESWIPVRDSVMSVNWRFRSEPAGISVDAGECPMLTRALSQQQLGADGEPEKGRDPKKDMSAETDALRYLIWGHHGWRATAPHGNTLRISGYV